MKEVVLDTETTGISIKEGHRIVEIGCIELDNLIPTKNKFHCYLNPERKVSEKALEVHGYTDKFLATQKKFSEIGEQFLKFIKDKRLIIHNADFDLGHLNNELEIFGKKKIVKTVHTEIRKKMNDFLKKHKNRKFVILDIPLLLENKINKKNDVLIFVKSKRSEILKRLKNRESFNKKLFNEFKNIQLPLDYKKKKSTFIIKNNFKKKSVRKDIKNILKNFR